MNIAFAITAILALLSLVALFVHERSNDSFTRFLLRRFFHDNEYSLPTLFNFVLIVCNAFFTSVIAATFSTQSSLNRNYWIGLVILFLVLAYDEAAQLHEEVMEVMRTFLVEHPLLHFPWTPVGAAAAIILALVYLPFLRQLPRRTAFLILIAGVTYVAGALMLETIGGYYDFYNDRDFSYHAISLVEETLEMAGMIIFGYAVLKYIGSDVAPVSIRAIHEVE